MPNNETSEQLCLLQEVSYRYNLLRVGNICSQGIFLEASKIFQKLELLGRK